jgi:hypothetical protein
LKQNRLSKESTNGPSEIPGNDPLAATIDAFIGRLESRSREPNAKLTCNGLIEVIGPHSHALALLSFSLLNLLPLPPGVNWLLGLAITGLALLMTFGRPLRLWGWVGRRRLPLNMLVHLLGVLRWITRLVTRVSSPRLLPMTSPRVMPAVGLFGVVMGLAMLIPIPLSNMLPASGLAAISLGVLNRDGLLIVLGALIGIVGIAIVVLATWLLLAVFLAIDETLDGT